MLELGCRRTGLAPTSQSIQVYLCVRVQYHALDGKAMLPDLSALALRDIGDIGDIGVWAGASDPKTGRPLPELPSALRQHVLELMGRGRGKQAVLRLMVCQSALDKRGRRVKRNDRLGNTLPAAALGLAAASTGRMPDTLIRGQFLMVRMYVDSTAFEDYSRYGAQESDEHAVLSADNMSDLNLTGVVSFMRQGFAPKGWVVKPGDKWDRKPGNVLYFVLDSNLGWDRRRTFTPPELVALIEAFKAELQEFMRRVRWLLLPMPRQHQSNNCFVDEVYVLRPDVPVADK